MTAVPADRLIAQAVTLANPEWLPTDSGLDWLDELGATHRRLLASVREAASHRSDLPRQFEAEDKRHRDALALGFRNPGAAPSHPEPTPHHLRHSMVAAADDELAAAQAALDGFLAEAITTLEERAPDALPLIATRREEAAAKRAEAQRILEEATATEADAFRLEEWLARNAGTHRNPMFRVREARFFPFDQMQQRTPPPPPSDAPQLNDPPELPPWDAEARARRRAFEERQRRGEPTTYAEALQRHVDDLNQTAPTITFEEDTAR